MTLLKDSSGTAGQSYADLVDSQESVSIVAHPATGVAATDTARIQALLTSAAASGASRVLLREGTYAITNLTFPVQGSGSLTLSGQGPGKTILSCSASSGYAITFGDGGVTDTRWQSVTDLQINGNANADGAIRFNHSRVCSLRRVFVQDFTKAAATSVYFVGGEHNYFADIVHCQFRNSPIGVFLEGAGFIGGNSNRIVNCHFGIHSTCAVKMTGVTSNFVERNEFNGSITTGVVMDTASAYNTLVGNTFDGPPTAVSISGSCTGITMLGNIGMSSVIDAGIGTVRIDSGGNKLASSAGTTVNEGDFSVATVGKGLRVKEGSNAKQGVSTLVAGTVVVANTSVTATSRIQLTAQSLGTVAAPKALAVTARTASTSFTITSSDATDTSVVAWEIFEPA